MYTVLHLLIVAPLSAQLESLTEKEIRLKMKFEREQLKLRMREPLIDRLNTLDERDQSLAKTLPDAISDRRASAYFIALANEHAINLEAVDVLAPVSHEFYEIKSMALSGQAGYANFVRFVQAINQHQQLAWCDVLSLNADPAEQGAVHYQMTCALPYALLGAEDPDA